jgi:hypothetical protein
VFEIAASGVELAKIAIGKPASTADASNGFMSTDLLAQCVAEAKGMHWAAGVALFQVCIALAYSLRGRTLMAFHVQFSSNLAVWIETVRGKAFPIRPTMPI